MNIGEEEEAIEVPMPLAPGKQQPIHEPSPQVEPVKEPVHARVLVGANSPLCGYCGNNDHTETNCPFKPRKDYWFDQRYQDMYFAIHGEVSNG